MPIDWTQPLQTGHERPRAAKLLDGRSPDGKRRVSITGDFALSGGPGGVATGAYDGRHGTEGWPTVFLFDEAGAATRAAPTVPSTCATWPSRC